MDFKEKKMEQCRKPNGFFGKITIKRMNKGHSELASWGLNFLSIKPNYTILDIGCGGGLNVYNFAQKLDKGIIYGVDYSGTSVNASKKLNKNYIKSGKVKISQESVSSLSFPDNKFDLITGFETYYFWPDLDKNFKNILRMLKPNGTFLLVNEVFKCKDKNKRIRNEGWAKLGKFHIHNQEEFQNLFENANFKDIRVEIEKSEEYIALIGKK